LETVRVGKKRIGVKREGVELARKIMGRGLGREWLAATPRCRNDPRGILKSARSVYKKVSHLIQN